MIRRKTRTWRTRWPRAPIPPAMSAKVLLVRSGSKSPATLRPLKYPSRRPRLMIKRSLCLLRVGDFLFEVVYVPLFLIERPLLSSSLALSLTIDAPSFPVFAFRLQSIFLASVLCSLPRWGGCPSFEYAKREKESGLGMIMVYLSEALAGSPGPSFMSIVCLVYAHPRDTAENAPLLTNHSTTTLPSLKE